MAVKQILYTGSVDLYTWTADPALLKEELQIYDLPKVFLDVPVIKGRNRWLISLPAVVLQPGAAALPWPAEQDVVAVALRERRKEFLHAFKPLKEHTWREQRGFYSATFLDEVGPLLGLPAVASAFAAYIRAAKDTPSIVVKNPSKMLQARPPGFGQGYTWLPWEDLVLRSWFGKRTTGPHAGKRAKLTESEWEIVLQNLKGRRTKAQVKSRLTTLNRRLRISLLVEGFLPRRNVEKYQDEALSEGHTPLPRFRPRIKGRSYRGDDERPVLGQPD